DTEGGRDLAVAVNVSARNLTKEDFASRVLATLRRVGAAPGRLIVEITETALLADPDGAAAALRELSDHGVKISIDDFGQGQTSPTGWLGSHRWPRLFARHPPPSGSRGIARYVGPGPYKRGPEGGIVANGKARKSKDDQTGAASKTASSAKRAASKPKAQAAA